MYICNVGFYKSTDAGKTLQEIHTPHVDHHNLWIDPKDGQRMIIADDGGAQISLDGGAHWSTYNISPLNSTHNAHLRIDKGVLILGSQNFADYPDMDTRIAGLEMKWPAALINALNVKNVAITGEGIVNARGKFCWDK